MEHPPYSAQRSGRRSGLRVLHVALATSGLFAAGCTVRRPPASVADVPPCTADPTLGDDALSVMWILRDDPDERSALDAYCWGVGPIEFVAGAMASGVPALDSLAVISWNSYIGTGQLDSLITDLRTGRLTGQPVHHYVLLLQEMHRAGEVVPTGLPSWVSVGQPGGDMERPNRRDVAAVAGRHGLWLFYAPSMRTGRSDDGQVEDRGNAILSTLPLQSPLAIELPFERQRRIAVAAHVYGRSTDGQPWSLRLVSAHLDNRTRLGRIYRSLGAGRTRQAEALAQHLADHEPTVLGADLNTWLGGAGAGAVRALRDVLPLPAHVPGGGTSPLPGPLPDLRLDYLMFRLPDGWAADYRVLAGTYGSDHRPLLGWVHTSTLAVDSLPSTAR